MGDVLMIIVLILTSLLTYHWSYGKLWFLVDSLFEAMVAPSSTRGMEKIPQLEIDDNHFLYKLYANYSVSSTKILKAIRIVFSMAMVSYVITIEIVLWQIKSADVKQQANFISTWIWPFVSLALSVLLILIQPFFALMMLLNKFFDDKLDVDSLIIVTSGALLVLITALNFTTIGPFKYTENILTKLSIVGITIMAILSSIASVSTLYYTYTMVRSKIKYSATDHSRKVFDDNSTGTLLWYADDMVINKMEEYQKHMDETIKILNRLDKEHGGKESPMRMQLMDKICWYQLELGQLESRLKEPKHMQTAKKVFQFSFLLYCFQKIVMTFTKRIPLIITDIIRGRQYSQLEDNNLGADPLAITIANILDIIFFRFNYQHDLDALTRQISLIISTSLFVCSFSTVATTISYMIALLPTRFRILVMYAIHSGESPSELPQFKKGAKASHNYKSPSIVKNLFVSELSGVYVVATILTIRSNLPFDVSQKVNELLGQRFTVPNVVIDSWFEIIYAIFCILTMIGIKAVERTLLE
ncbi:hypothetical protein ZYGR_0AK04530 [Zygosaccharomyces rouxii]|uniref:Abscisic acid G-protein coupled receptor-like domain-containing protein n=1 Tax=Zygosaccharomyces rouxii TaxID=4956 RepID=A0A1Q3AE60_ZYGRO|nr:hypothetical protein ZYGR_0AK04530 [Zygosaccharomyces rouxii]